MFDKSTGNVMTEAFGDGNIRIDKNGIDLFTMNYHYRVERMNGGYMWSIFDNDGLLSTSSIFDSVKECIENCKSARI